MKNGNHICAEFTRTFGGSALTVASSRCAAPSLRPASLRWALRVSATPPNYETAQQALQSSPELEAQRRVKLSAEARRRGLGRYHQESGRGRKGRYKGHWCDSSDELAFVIYALDQGMAFTRNWQAFPYVFEGRVRTWIPDFRLSDGTNLEIKGYVSPQAEAKFAAFPRGLIVVHKENLSFVFDYVIQKYGRDFTRLYE